MLRQMIRISCFVALLATVALAQSEFSGEMVQTGKKKRTKVQPKSTLAKTKCVSIRRRAPIRTVVGEPLSSI